MDRDELHIKFGKTIHKLRKKQKMTLEELSELTDIKAHYLVKIENGTAKRLNAGHIFIFARAFKIEPYEIFKALWFYDIIALC